MFYLHLKETYASLYPISLTLEQNWHFKAFSRFFSPQNLDVDRRSDALFTERIQMV